MVRIVVGQQQSLAQKGLAVAPRDAGVEISFWICDQILHGLQIFSEMLNALVPCGGVRGCFRLRPVSLGPFWRLVFRVAAELENIPLSKAKVLEDHPGRM